MDRNLTRQITFYLMKEDLIELRGNEDVSITHEGIREVEYAWSHPDKPTTYFPPVNIINIGQMINSQIQQASPEAIQVTNIKEERYDKVMQLIWSLKESVNQLEMKMQQKSDIEAEIHTIEAQMTSSKPKPSIISECLITIKRILEGIAVAAGSTAVTDLINRIAVLLGGQ